MALTDKEYETHFTAVMTELKKNKIEQSDVSNYMWEHIQMHDYCFGLKGEVGIETLKKITKIEMIAFFKEIFIDAESCKSYEIHVTPEMHLEEQEKERTKRK